MIAMVSGWYINLVINLHKEQYDFDNKKAIISSNYILVFLWILPDT